MLRGGDLRFERFSKKDSWLYKVYNRSKPNAGSPDRSPSGLAAAGYAGKVAPESPSKYSESSNPLSSSYVGDVSVGSQAYQVRHAAGVEGYETEPPMDTAQYKSVSTVALEKAFAEQPKAYQTTERVGMGLAAPKEQKPATITTKKGVVWMPELNKPIGEVDYSKITKEERYQLDLYKSWRTQGELTSKENIMKGLTETIGGKEYIIQGKGTEYGIARKEYETAYDAASVSVQKVNARIQHPTPEPKTFLDKIYGKYLQAESFMSKSYLKPLMPEKRLRSWVNTDVIGAVGLTGEHNPFVKAFVPPEVQHAMVRFETRFYQQGVREFRDKPIKESALFAGSYGIGKAAVASSRVLATVKTPAQQLLGKVITREAQALGVGLTAAWGGSVAYEVALTPQKAPEILGTAAAEATAIGFGFAAAKYIPPKRIVPTVVREDAITIRADKRGAKILSEGRITQGDLSSSFKSQQFSSNIIKPEKAVTIKGEDYSTVLLRTKAGTQTITIPTERLGDVTKALKSGNPLTLSYAKIDVMQAGKVVPARIQTVSELIGKEPSPKVRELQFGKVNIGKAERDVFAKYIVYRPLSTRIDYAPIMQGFPEPKVMATSSRSKEIWRGFKQPTNDAVVTQTNLFTLDTFNRNNVKSIWTDKISIDFGGETRGELPSTKFITGGTKTGIQSITKTVPAFSATPALKVVEIATPRTKQLPILTSFRIGTKTLEKTNQRSLLNMKEELGIAAIQKLKTSEVQKGEEKAVQKALQLPQLRESSREAVLLMSPVAEITREAQKEEQKQGYLQLPSLKNILKSRGKGMPLPLEIGMPFTLIPPPDLSFDFGFSTGKRTLKGRKYKYAPSLIGLSAPPISKMPNPNTMFSGLEIRPLVKQTKKKSKRKKRKTF